MALFTMPDGRAFDAPPDMSYDAADAWARQNYPDAYAAQKPPAQSGFMANLGAGAKSLYNTSALGIGALGDTDAAVKNYQQSEAANPVKTTSWQDIKDAYNKQGIGAALGTTGAYLRDFAAQNAPMVGASMAGAKAGAMAGAMIPGLGETGLGELGGALIGGIAPLIPSMAGSSIARQVEANPGQAPNVGTAWAAGTAEAALQAIPTLGLLSKELGVTKLAGKAVDAWLNKTPEQIEAAMLETAQQSLTKAAATGAVKGVATAMPTMVAQEVIERWQAGQPLTGDDANQSYISAAANGGLFGGLLGPVHGAMERSGAQAQKAKLQDAAAQASQAQLAKEQAEDAAKKTAYQQSDEGLLELDNTYQTQQQQFKDLLGQKSALKDAAPGSAEEVQLGDINAQIKAMMPQMRETAADWNANKAAITRAKVSPLDYALDNTETVLTPSGVNKPFTFNAGEPESAAQDYAKQQIGAAQQLDTGSFTPEHFAGFLMQDPEQARQLIAEKQSLPDMPKMQSSAIIKELKSQLQQHDLKQAADKKAAGEASFEEQDANLTGTNQPPTTEDPLAPWKAGLEDRGQQGEERQDYNPQNVALPEGGTTQVPAAPAGTYPEGTLKTSEQRAAEKTAREQLAAAQQAYQEAHAANAPNAGELYNAVGAAQEKLEKIVEPQRAENTTLAPPEQTDPQLNALLDRALAPAAGGGTPATAEDIDNSVEHLNDIRKSLVGKYTNAADAQGIAERVTSRVPDPNNPIAQQHVQDATKAAADAKAELVASIVEQIKAAREQAGLIPIADEGKLAADVGRHIDRATKKAQYDQTEVDRRRLTTRKPESQQITSKHADTEADLKLKTLVAAHKANRNELAAATRELRRLDRQDRDASTDSDVAVAVAVAAARVHAAQEATKKSQWALDRARSTTPSNTYIFREQERASAIQRQLNHINDRLSALTGHDFARLDRRLTGAASAYADANPKSAAEIKRLVQARKNLLQQEGLSYSGAVVSRAVQNIVDRYSIQGQKLGNAVRANMERGAGQASRVTGGFELGGRQYPGTEVPNIPEGKEFDRAHPYKIVKTTPVEVSPEDRQMVMQQRDRDIAKLNEAVQGGRFKGDPAKLTEGLKNLIARRDDPVTQDEINNAKATAGGTDTSTPDLISHGYQQSVADTTEAAERARAEQAIAQVNADASANGLAEEREKTLKWWERAEKFAKNPLQILGAHSAALQRIYDAHLRLAEAKQRYAGAASENAQALHADLERRQQEAALGARQAAQSVDAIIARLKAQAEAAVAKPSPVETKPESPEAAARRALLQERLRNLIDLKRQIEEVQEQLQSAPYQNEAVRALDEHVGKYNEYIYRQLSKLQPLEEALTRLEQQQAELSNADPLNERSMTPMESGQLSHIEDALDQAEGTATTARLRANEARSKLSALDRNRSSLSAVEFNKQRLDIQRQLAQAEDKIRFIEQGRVDERALTPHETQRAMDSVMQSLASVEQEGKQAEIARVALVRQGATLRGQKDSPETVRARQVHELALTRAKKVAKEASDKAAELRAQLSELRRAQRKNATELSRTQDAVTSERDELRKLKTTRTLYKQGIEDSESYIDEINKRNEAAQQRIADLTQQLEKLKRVVKESGFSGSEVDKIKELRAKGVKTDSLTEAMHSAKRIQEEIYAKQQQLDDIESQSMADREAASDPRIAKIQDSIADLHGTLRDALDEVAKQKTAAEKSVGTGETVSRPAENWLSGAEERYKASIERAHALQERLERMATEKKTPESGMRYQPTEPWGKAEEVKSQTGREVHSGQYGNAYYGTDEQHQTEAAREAAAEAHIQRMAESGKPAIRSITGSRELRVDVQEKTSTAEREKIADWLKARGYPEEAEKIRESDGAMSVQISMPKSIETEDLAKAIKQAKAQFANAIRQGQKETQIRPQKTKANPKFKTGEPAPKRGGRPTKAASEAKESYAREDEAVGTHDVDTSEFGSKPDVFSAPETDLPELTVGQTREAAAHPINGKSFAEAAQWLLGKQTDPLKRAFTARVLQALKGVGGKIEFSTEHDETGPGNYNSGDHRITISPRLMGNDSLLHDTLLHELTHAATVKGLMLDDVLRKQMYQLTQRVSNWLKTDEGKAYVEAHPEILNHGEVYGLNDVYEFAAETFANPDFQKLLKQIPSDIPKQGVFERFINYIAKLFGAKSPVELNTLQDAVDLTNKAMTSNWIAHNTEGFDAKGMNFASPKAKHVDDDMGKAADTFFRADPSTLSAKNKVNNLLLGGRILAVDMDAGLMRAVKQGDPHAAMQLDHDLMMSKNVGHFDAQAFNHGALQLVDSDIVGGKKTYTVKAVDGANLHNVAKLLGKIKDRGNEQAVSDQFSMLAAGLRARGVVEGKGLGWDRVFGDNPKDTPAQMAARANARTQADKLVDEYRAGNSPFQAAYKEYQEFNKNMFKFVRDAGVIGDKAFRDLTAGENYTPLFRVDPNNNLLLKLDSGRTITVGSLKDEPHLRELLGGSQKILDWHLAAAQNTHLLINEGLKNLAQKRAAMTLFALDKNIAGEVTRGATPVGPREKGPNIIEFRHNGDLQRFQVNTDAFGIPTKYVMAALEGVPTSMPGFIRLMGKPATLLRKTATRTPFFMLRSIIRDPLEAWVGTGAKFNPITSTLEQIGKGLVGKTDPNLERSGIVGGMLFAHDFQDLNKLRDDAMGNPSLVGRFLAGAERMTQIADGIERHSVYNAAIKAGAPEIQALLAAYKSMPYSTRGSSSGIRLANHIIPFLNSAIQGWDVLYRGITNQAPLADRVNVRNQLLLRGGIIAGLSAMYALSMQDDPTYQKMDAGTRLNNWLVHVPGFDTPIKLPVPFELGIFFKMVPEVLVRTMVADKNVGDEITELGKQAANMFPAVGIPTAVKPLIEAYNNFNFETGSQVENESMQKLDINQRYGHTTAELSKLFGFQVDAFGHQYGVSPQKLEFMASEYTAGVYPLFAAMIDNILPAPAAAKPTRSLAQMPMFRGILQQEDQGGLVTRLYDRVEQWQRSTETFKELALRDRPAALEYMKAHQQDIMRGGQAEAIKQAVTKFSTIENAIYNNQNMLPDAKKEALDRLHAQRSRFVSQMLPDA